MVALGVLLVKAAWPPGALAQDIKLSGRYRDGVWLIKIRDVPVEPAGQRALRAVFGEKSISTRLCFDRFRALERSICQLTDKGELCQTPTP